VFSLLSFIPLGYSESTEKNLLQIKHPINDIKLNLWIFMWICFCGMLCRGVFEVASPSSIVNIDCYVIIKKLLDPIYYLWWEQQLSYQVAHWYTGLLFRNGAYSTYDVPQRCFRQSTIMKNAIFWDFASCGSYKNRCFRGPYRLHHESDKNWRALNTVREFPLMFLAVRSLSLWWWRR
jgi:hypothetical protein